MSTETTERTGKVASSLAQTRCPVPHHRTLATPFIGSKACTFCPYYAKHTNDHSAGTVTVTCRGRVG